MRQQGDWIFRVVPIFIGFVFVVILAMWAGYAYLGWKAVGALENCTPAITSKNVDGEQQYSVGCKK